MPSRGRSDPAEQADSRVHRERLNLDARINLNKALPVKVANGRPSPRARRAECVSQSYVNFISHPRSPADWKDA